MSNFLSKGKIINWVDGDTLIAEIDLGFNVKFKTSIRLLRINTWEIRDRSAYRRRWAKHARAVAKKLFPENSQIIIRTKKTDRYKRWLADVSTAEKMPKDFATELLKNVKKGIETYGKNNVKK